MLLLMVVIMAALSDVQISVPAPLDRGKSLIIHADKNHAANRPDLQVGLSYVLSSRR